MDLDVALEELGQLGRYQIINLTFIAFSILFTAYFSISYVFTASDLQYRCLIPECESDEENAYQPPWLNYAIPIKPDKLYQNCIRYKPKSMPLNKTCTEDSFTNETEICDLYVFATNQTTIISDFGLLCNENEWKRTFVGTINNIGQFLGLPLAGLFSDRFGRKFMVITGSLLSTVMGISRSFCSTYTSFLIFEFLDAFVATGIYSGGFILAVELVNPEKRVLISAIISCVYPIGEIILGTTMWFSQNWRVALRILYAPGFFFMFYIWLIPESLRWLMANGKYKETVVILKRISSVNNKPFTLNTKTKLDSLCNIHRTGDENKDDIVQNPLIGSKKLNTSTNPVHEIIKSKRMIMRFINCSFCWMTDTFVFYGLSLNSMAVAGNTYLNFILVSLVEIPGYFSTCLFMDVIGRRASLFLSLATSGCSCLAFHFIPNDMVTTRLALFLIGKMAITSSFAVTYVFSAEMFPTNARHFLLGTCSMFGRIGSMIAPQTPLLADLIDPTLLFGTVSLVAGFFALFFPETLRTRLPDNVLEAEQIGSTHKIVLTNESDKLEPEANSRAENV